MVVELEGAAFGRLVVTDDRARAIAAAIEGSLGPR